jgi:HEAT repeats
MSQWSRAVFSLVVVLLTTLAQARSPLDELIEQLKKGDDFRVRVQAALQLGKSKSSEALDPLVGALDDGNASVRAAAAAALRSLKDKRAIPALKEHRLDRSDAVREAIKTALETLNEDEDASAGGATKVLVKIGIMKNGSSVKSPRIESQLAQDSRKKLAELPGVRVLPDSEDSGKSSEQKIPVVMVTGQVQELRATREGTSIVYSASVEYVLHTMPERSIAAKVSGSASATASEQEAKDSERSAELRRQVLEAAIASALRRAPRAIMAAARQ